MSEAPSYKRLLAELKRRNVFRVAAVYGATAFVVLQVIDLLQQGLHLPEIVLTLVTALALACFPIALALAWVYERTPAGVKRTREAAPGEISSIVAAPASKRWPVGLAAAAGTALLLVGSWWAVGTPAAPGSGGRAEYTSIAVLPFVNLSGDEAHEYFSDGLSEELLNALTRVPGLRVAGRTSSFAFKGENRDLREIGDTLGVETILEGSVRRAGGRVRVTAQLIDTRDGFHLWSQEWDVELTAENVFEIQEQIAQAVAVAMASSLGPSGVPQPDVVPSDVRTPDLEAYDLYLLGRHRWATRSPEGLTEAVEYFEAALRRDSMFVPAWVGLSAAYNALPWYTGYPGGEAGDRSKRTALRALELDPDNAEALYTLATTVYEYERDWETAEDYFARALVVDPTYAQGLAWYGAFMVSRGRPEEAITWCTRAVELEPLLLNALLCVGEALEVLGRWEEAISLHSRVLAREPGFQTAAHGLAYSQARLGLWGEAEGTLRRWAVARDAPERGRLAVELVAGLRDPAARARTVAAVRQWRTGSDAMPAYQAVKWLLLAEAKEEALQMIEAMVAKNTPELSGLASTPGTGKLRGEPRFEAALATANLTGVPLPATE